MKQLVRVIDPRWSHGLVALGLGVAVVLSWQTHFLPTSRKLQQMRERLTALRQQVGEAEQLLSQAGGEAAWTALNQEVLQRLRQRLPRSRAVPRLLDALLERVQGAGLALVNVSQGNLEPAADASGQPMALEQAPCLQLPVTLTVEGRFHQVVALQEQLLSSGFPCVVKLAGVQFALRNPASGSVSAVLQLLLYVLGS